MSVWMKNSRSIPCKRSLQVIDLMREANFANKRWLMCINLYFAFPRPDHVNKKQAQDERIVFIDVHLYRH